MENGLELVELLRGTFCAEPISHWRAVFQERGIVAGFVAEMEDLPHDPQILANNMVVAPSDPRVQSRLVVNHPLNIDGLARAGVTYAPLAGENTAEVLTELGLDAATIADYAARGVTS